MKAIRWSGDGDRYWGPFTYARDRRGYRPVALVLGSGSPDYPGCRLRMSAFGHTLILALPSIIKPAKEWVDTSHYAWSTNGGYWDVHEREYGFSCTHGHLSVTFGQQTDDSTTEQGWGCFLPWRSWRLVRHSFYGLDGGHIGDMPHRRTFAGMTTEEHRAFWAEQESVKARCPTQVFGFTDFDGEQIKATTRIEEREWRLGEGRWRWLSIFRRPRVSRSLSIDFSAETGRRKGSWKGGTVGASIEMEPGELHEAAFRRYCAQNGMTFIAEVAQ